VAVVDGLKELREALQALPDQLQAEAERVVMQEAEETASTVRATYQQVRSPLETYTLKGGIKKARKHLADSVEVSSRGRKTGAAVARVKVNSPHAHWFEFGTQNRQWENGKSTGAAPARPTLIPTAIRNRREMVDELIAVVEKTGLKVTRNG
jgi:HK97 gp10 family phage protein